MKTVSFAVVVTLAVLCGAPASAQERLGAIPPGQMTEAQKQAVADFTKVRKNGPFGFWWGYLRVPEVTIPFLEIQTYVHDVLESPNSAIGEKLTHFAILMVARQWTQQVIWSLHEANAIKSGLKPEIVGALAAGARRR
jgi:4-carboxymuconolactone decarboxylase